MINLIVATGAKGEIGRSNGLLWRLSSDLKRFKAITMGHPMVMGRKTYESIGKPLPGRTSIVVTRLEGMADEQVDAETSLVWVNSLEEALEKGRELDDEIYVIGGGQIYEQALPYVDRIYWTRIAREFPEADTFFQVPAGYSEFQPELEGEENDLTWEYGVVEKE